MDKLISGKTSFDHSMMHGLKGLKPESRRVSKRGLWNMTKKSIPGICPP